MILNYIWIALFAIGFILGVIKLCLGDATVFPAMMDSTFETATQGFEMALGLTGVLTLWMGIMRVGEVGGAVVVLSIQNQKIIMLLPGFRPNCLMLLYTFCLFPFLLSYCSYKIIS